MADSLCLLDTNILLRWIKPDDRDYPVVVSAIEAMLLAHAVLCYTSQNVGEFWNTCTRPVDRNGYGLSPARRIIERGILKIDCDSYQTLWRFTMSGAECW